MPLEINLVEREVHIKDSYKIFHKIMKNSRTGKPRKCFKMKEEDMT